MRLLPVLFVVAACGGIERVPDRAHGFVEPTASLTGRYRVYVPTRTSDEKLPVIVYLHGGGERGDDGIAPTQVGIGPIVWKSDARFPFIVAFPQCVAGGYWTDPAMEARALAVVDETVREFGGDPDRVYLTGNSLGGFGTWILAAKHPERFAAIVPISGGVIPPFGGKAPKGSLADSPDPYGAVAKALGKMPVWAFHGEKDWLVNPDNSRKMVAALVAAGNPAKLTVLTGVGHPAEDVAYTMPELFTWLAAQRRSAR